MDLITNSKTSSYSVKDFLNEELKNLVKRKLSKNDYSYFIGSITFKRFDKKEGGSFYDAEVNFNQKPSGSCKIVIGSYDDKYVIDSFFVLDINEGLDERLILYRSDPKKYGGHLEDGNINWKIHAIEMPFYILDEIKEAYESGIKEAFDNPIIDTINVDENSPYKEYAYQKGLSFEIGEYKLNIELTCGKFSGIYHNNSCFDDISKSFRARLNFKFKNLKKYQDLDYSFSGDTIHQKFRREKNLMFNAHPKSPYVFKFLRIDKSLTYFEDFPKNSEDEILNIKNKISNELKEIFNDIKKFNSLISEQIKLTPSKAEPKSLITSDEINKDFLLLIMKEIYSKLYSKNHVVLHVGEINFDSSSNQNFMYVLNHSEKIIHYLYFNLEKKPSYLLPKSVRMKMDSLQFLKENRLSNLNYGKLEIGGITFFNFSDSQDKISHDYTINLSEFYNSKTSIFSFKILDIDKDFILDSDYKKNFSLNEITPYYEEGKSLYQGKSLVVKNKSIHDYETTIVENSSIKIDKANSNHNDEIKLSDNEIKRIKEEKTKEIKKILRGIYLRALSNISYNIGLIYFNELKYLCVDEIEWIVRNENPEFEETQIVEIMAHVNKVIDSSIVTTIRKCIIGVGENIWDKINDKKLLEVYRLFKVVNGEKIPKKMLLASYNFEKNKKSGQSYHAHNRFRTINDFEALDLVNKKIYYKTNYPELGILSNEIKTINQSSATVVGKGKVRFEKNIMSLAEATRIIDSRQWEIINKHFADEGNSHTKQYEILFKSIVGKLSNPSSSWHTEEDCAIGTSLRRKYYKVMGFSRDDEYEYDYYWKKSLN